MKIEIENLGAIKSGVIDLSKKLNIFCGPNGTGKTYAAYVIYGVLKSQIYMGTRSNNVFRDLIKNKKTKFDIDFEQLAEYRSILLNNFKKDRLDSLFGISEELTNKYFGDTSISFVESDEVFKQNLINSEFNVIINMDKIDIEVIKNKYSDFVELSLESQTILADDIERIEFVLSSSIISLLASYPISSLYFLPVERNSIFTFSKELSIRKQEAIDHFHAMTGKEKLNMFDLLFKTTKRYPLPIRDGLIIAEDLAELKKQKSNFFNFAIEIENELLHGIVDVSEEGEIQFKPEKAPKRQLPIQITASVIKSLSSLVVYLKYLAKPNDLIIIDEPEINLHPDNQLILTRIFARLINKGFRLIISTHSDYIIRELNNLIMLSSDKPEMLDLRDKYGYKKEETLMAGDVDVLYFNFPNTKTKNKQVTIQHLKVNETGFEVPSIDATIERQNSIGENLFYTLKYGKDE